jgi:hypothetical protein
MAISVTHTFVSAVADESDPDEVGPDEWNAAHTLTGFGTGVETALAVNVGSAGAFVTFNGALGTPSSGTLTNATGLPIAGITGLGTGVGTALAVNTGSAGAFVLFDGAGGTPSSLTLTNATGLPVAGITASTTTALGVGSIELGHATDTTLSRASAGVLAVEGVNVLTTATGQPLDADLTSWAGVTRAAGFDTWVATPSSANLASLVSDETGTGALVFANTPTLVTPAIGAATGTSLILTGTSATIFSAGRQGATTPVLNLDASAASSATGINIAATAAGSRALVSALSSGTDEGLSIDAKGSGTIRLGATSTGAVEFSRNAVPTASDGAALGTTALMWSDAFFASGGVLNFNNGNVTLTHSAAKLQTDGATTIVLNTTSSGKVGLGTETNPQEPLAVSVNTTTGLAAPANTIAHLTGANTATSLIVHDVYGASGGPAIVGRSANGTAASQTATIANDALLSFGGRGHDGTSFVTANKALILFAATENWSGTAQGTYFGFFTTANATTTRSEVVRIQNSGGMSVGSGVVATDHGNGSIVMGGTLSRAAPVTETGATHTLAATTSYLICDRAGTVTVTLPAAASFVGKEVYIKTIQAQTVVSASSNVVPQVGGAASTAILAATDGAWAKLVSDGTNWIIMAQAVS